MKTIILKSTIVIMVTMFTVSCKKDYVCSCSKTYTSSNGNTYTESDGKYTYKDTRIRASERCTQLEGTGVDIYGGYTRDCEIK
ncbi:MAG: hypothetical protein U0W65_13815 [Bacteroidia bacterium]